MNRPISLLLAASVMAIPVRGGADTPPSPRPGETRSERPPDVPPVVRAETVTLGRPPAATGDSADAGRWKGARAIKIRAGEADVRLIDGSSVHLRAGDVVGADTVDRIDAGRILLSRRAADAAPTGPKLATVVVSFDGSGVARTRIYWLEDPKAAPPPFVK